MDKIFNVRNSGNLHPICPLSENCEYGKGDTVPIDQTPSKSFNLDPSTGMPIYDVTAILKANNKAEQDRLLQQLEEFKSDYLPSDVSDVDALKYFTPRLCQLPSELAELTEKFTEKRLAELKAKKDAEQLDAFRKSLSDKKDDDEKEDDETKS